MFERRRRFVCRHAGQLPLLPDVFLAAKRTSLQADLPNLRFLPELLRLLLRRGMFRWFPGYRSFHLT